MSNPKPNFLKVIKASSLLITKHPQNISLSSKRNTNQGRITFKSYINKSHLLSFIYNMYNSIKLNNHSSLDFEKCRESTNKLPHTPTENTSTSSMTRIYPLAAPSVLILTQPGEGNSYLTRRDKEL